MVEEWLKSRCGPPSKTWKNVRYNNMLNKMLETEWTQN